MGFVQRDHMVEALAVRAADPSFRDAVLPGTAATKAVTVPTTGTDQRRVEVRATGSYWGAVGVQIF